MIIRRILAFAIDWNLSGIPALIYALILSHLARNGDVPAILMILFVLFVFSMPALFVVRDVMFNGRSVGKRIFKLWVIENKTGETPKKAILCIRNLFFMVYPIDFILLLVKRRTLGDIATNTSVVKR